MPITYTVGHMAAIAECDGCGTTLLNATQTTNRIDPEQLHRVVSQARWLFGPDFSELLCWPCQQKPTLNTDFGCACCTCATQFDVACRAHGLHGVRPCALHGSPGENCSCGCGLQVVATTHEVIPEVVAASIQDDTIDADFVRRVLITIYLAAPGLVEGEVATDLYGIVADAIGGVAPTMIQRIATEWLAQKATLDHPHTVSL